MDPPEDDLWRLPSTPECRAWVAGRQMAAIRSYRARVYPDRGLEAVVVAFEESTHVGRCFRVLETVHLGTRED